MHNEYMIREYPGHNMDAFKIESITRSHIVLCNPGTLCTHDGYIMDPLWTYSGHIMCIFSATGLGSNVYIICDIICDTLES